MEDEDTGEEKAFPFLRYFNVFHIDQCEGIAPKFRAIEPQIITPAIANDAAEAVIHDYIATSGVKLVSRESSEAFYRPSTDTVVLPLIKQFGDTDEYYSTAFHELTHSTGTRSGSTASPKQRGSGVLRIAAKNCALNWEQASCSIAWASRRPAASATMPPTSITGWAC